MNVPTSEALTAKRCLPCEGGVAVLEPAAAKQYLKATPEWTLGDDSKSISRKVAKKNFVQAIELVNQIAEIAESEGHHPDLHLTGYRNLKIELTTHAIGGLSENDFILAAKIDEVLS